jgi:hypothetical protein
MESQQLNAKTQSREDAKKLLCFSFAFAPLRLKLVLEIEPIED